MVHMKVASMESWKEMCWAAKWAHERAEKWGD